MITSQKGITITSSQVSEDCSAGLAVLNMDLNDASFLRCYTRNNRDGLPQLKACWVTSPYILIYCRKVRSCVYSPFSLQPLVSPFPLPPPSLLTDRVKFNVYRNVICMCGTSNVHLIYHSRCHMRGAHFPYSDLQIEDQRRCGLQTSESRKNR